MTYVTNRKARFEFEIINTLEAGVILAGHEVKSIRNGRAKLDGAHVKLYNHEAWLVNSSVTPYQIANTPKNYNPERPRQLLLTKQELARLTRHLNTAGLTIVPLRLYNNNGKIKLEIALVRGKKKTDKRQTLQDRDTKRSIERTLKRQNAE